MRRGVGNGESRRFFAASNPNRNKAVPLKKFQKPIILPLLRKNPPCYCDYVRTTIQLTPRGREVFELAMSGLSIREISKRLGISYSGVLRHREKMLLANECNSMLELIATYRGTYPNRQL